MRATRARRDPAAPRPPTGAAAAFGDSRSRRRVAVVPPTARMIARVVAAVRGDHPFVKLRIAETLTQLRVRAGMSLRPPNSSTEPASIATPSTSSMLRSVCEVPPAPVAAPPAGTAVVCAATSAPQSAGDVAASGSDGTRSLFSA